MDDELATELRRASARVDAGIAAVVEPAGITLAEWLVLRAAYRLGAVAPSALADACGITRGAVTKIVDRLRAKRLIVRAAAGRDDARYRTIALTGAGASLVARLLPMMADRMGTLSGPQQASLRALLALL